MAKVIKKWFQHNKRWSYGAWVKWMIGSGLGEYLRRPRGTKQGKHKR